MRISVFGMGYVGSVSCGCLADLGHDIVGVDISEEKIRLLAEGKPPVVEAGLDDLIMSAARSGRLTVTTSTRDAVARTDVSFISVGTPSGRNGRVVLSAVEEVCREIGLALREKAPGVRHVIVMRSTVPPGTAEECVIPILEQASGQKHGEGFAYYSNPEFLREGSAVADFRDPPFTILGAAEGDDAATVREIYAPLPASVHVVPYGVAEGLKMLCNAFHAAKLAFANEAGSVLASCGVDAPEIFRLFCSDRQLNISPAYLRPGFAFGGSCLPKDVRSFLALAHDRGVSTPFLGSILPSNDAVIERALALVASGGRRPVALLGLAFKPGTDDLRESPFVSLAERLLGKGYPLRIFDRDVDIARLTGSNRTYIDSEIPHLEKLLVPTVEDAVDGAETIIVGHLPREDQHSVLAKLQPGATMIDLAGIPALQNAANVIYKGICW